MQKPKGGWIQIGTCGILPEDDFRVPKYEASTTVVKGPIETHPIETH
jgi:hypothetical protein